MRGAAAGLWHVGMCVSLRGRNVNLPECCPSKRQLCYRCTHTQAAVPPSKLSSASTLVCRVHLTRVNVHMHQALTPSLLGWPALHHAA